MLIGIVGKARHGKDTIASAIRALLPAGSVEIVRFADPIKAFCRKVFDWTEDHTDGALKETGDSRYARDCGTCQGTGEFCHTRCAGCAGVGKLYLTPRRAMQLLGTEWGRACTPNVWADLALREASRRLNSSTRSVPLDVGSSIANHRLVRAPSVIVIPDVRFLNEAQAIADFGLADDEARTPDSLGCLIRVHRPGIDIQSSHASEADISSPAMTQLVDFDLLNSGSVEELRGRVGHTLHTLKLI